MKSKQEIVSEQVSGRILDVGYAQEPNSHLKGEIHGIDIIKNEKAGYFDTHTVDLNTDLFPYPPNFFDSVVIGCTLAHIANPLKVLGEINRVLKDGGRLVVTSPNPHYYWEVVLNVFYHFFKNRVAQAKKEEHFYSFSRFDMRTILERSGFKVIDEKGYLFALVKTSLRFNPIRHPGIAYEIIYIANKIGSMKNYTTTKKGNVGEGIIKVETKY